MPSLNEGEHFKISFLAKTETIFPEEPSIYVRGDGITATKMEKNSSVLLNFSKENLLKDDRQKLFSGLIAPMTGVASLSVAMFSLITLLRRRRTFISSGGKHRDNQRRILAYICGIHGLLDEVDRYLSLPKNSAYYTEIDRLTSIAITNNNDEHIAKLKKVILDLMSYTSMAETSLAILYYNLARLEKIQGNQNEVDQYLGSAKKLEEKLVVYQEWILSLKKRWLISSPITVSCIKTDFEKQIVRRANRLIRVRKSRCLRSMLCV